MFLGGARRLELSPCNTMHGREWLWRLSLVCTTHWLKKTTKKKQIGHHARPRRASALIMRVSCAAPTYQLHEQQSIVWWASQLESHPYWNNRNNNANNRYSKNKTHCVNSGAQARTTFRHHRDAVREVGEGGMNPSCSYGLYGGWTPVGGCHGLS